VIDTFGIVLYSDGEELTPDDLISSQNVLSAYLTDQILESLCPREFTDPVAFDRDFWGISGDESRRIAYCIAPGGAYIRPGSANNKISLGRGVLLQKSADQNGNGSTFIPFSFGNNTTDAPDLWTIANGDATNARVDLLQMQLTTIDDTPVSRLIKTNPVKAILDLSALTTHENTILRAKIGGNGGNAISVVLQKRSTGTGVSYSENGNVVTILYQDGVSTVGDVETAITTSSTILEIQSSGTGANVLSDPADSFVATHLAGGVDPLIINTPPINTRRRVQAAFSVKQGDLAFSTPTSAETPLPDTGWAIVGSVIVGPGWTSATAMSFGIDGTLANNALVQDQRMPIGIKTYRVDPTAFKLVTAFSLTDSGFSATASSGTNLLYVPCPVATGRLVGYSIFFGAQACPNHDIASVGVFTNCTMASFVDLGGGFGSSTGAIGLADTDEHFDCGFFEQVNFLTHTPQNPIIGQPIWANGRRAARPKFKYGYDNGVSGGSFGRQGSVVGLDQLAIKVHAVTNGTKIGTVTFYIAEGL
jgi:hypothetical protein